MTALRLNDGERLAILAALALDTLDDRFSESELENSADLAGLYNLAAVMREAADAYPTTGVPGIDQDRNRARRADAEASADRQASEFLAYAGDGSHVGRVRKRLLEEVGRDALAPATPRSTATACTRGTTGATSPSDQARRAGELDAMADVAATTFAELERTRANLEELVDELVAFRARRFPHQGLRGAP